MVLVSQIAKQVRREIRPESNTRYKLLGLRLAGRGLFLREEKTGSEIKSPKLYRVRAGDFIYSRLFAWRGAFGVVSGQFDGCFVSSEFPCFVLEKELVDSEFLLRYILRPSILKEIEALCTGTTRLSRNRFKEDRFLNLDISLPSIDVQVQARKRLNALSDKLREFNTATEESVNLTKILRKTILRDGVLGKLVAQNANDEPASALLETIRREQNGVQTRAKLDRLTEVAREASTHPLPRGWVWARLGDICQIINGRARYRDEFPRVI